MSYWPPGGLFLGREEDPDLRVLVLEGSFDVDLRGALSERPLAQIMFEISRPGNIP